MRAFILIFIVLFSAACHFNAKVSKKYELYFDDQTYELFQKGINSYQNQDYKLADSLLTRVIANSKSKLTISMPTEFNPFYYRGHNNIELEKYQQSLNDFDQVASDTTTNTDILMTRTEAFKMLQQYDTAILLCDRLLKLDVDSAAILSQRGICYYQKGQTDKACADFILTKKLAVRDVSFLDKFMKDCK